MGSFGRMNTTLGKDGIKIIESNEDILLYDIGHIEGAIKLDWETELQDKLVSYKIIKLFL